MKKNYKIILVASCLIMTLVLGVFMASGMSASASSATKDEEVAKRVISVNGNGTIYAKPDVARVNLGVITKNKNVATAQKENQEAMTRVMKALKDMGFAEKYIQTIDFSISEVYNYENYDDNGKQKPKKEYQVVNMVCVTIMDITKVGETVDKAFVAGANNIGSIEFDNTKKDELYNEALTRAMNQAKDKANTIGKTFGKTFNEPSRVSESYSYQPIYRNSNVMAMKADMAGGSTEISSGQIAITANVSVEYNY